MQWFEKESHIESRNKIVGFVHITQKNVIKNALTVETQLFWK